jgi:HCOMODA/2-hydroxy-3-carboxy-muconic semialdehyde decarboxylase
MTDSDSEREIGLIKSAIVRANRILLRHQVLDAFGHISARHPAVADRFLMSKRLAPGLVREADIREYRLDGELEVQDGTAVFLERFIHGAIYAARPDVNAVVHSHSPAVIAFGVVPSKSLRPVCHTCGFMKGGVPVFEMRNVAGAATDLLIRTNKLGKALADALGTDNVVLMRGHGSTTVGTSISQAVYRAVYTEINAKVQTTASILGSVTFLSEEEALASEASSDVQVERTWEFWLSERV